VRDILNVNKKRKAKIRAEKEVAASQNRLKYGRTKQQKRTDQLKIEKLELHLQAHKRETKEE
jgi:hypothetical protein